MLRAALALASVLLMHAVHPRSARAVFSELTTQDWAQLNAGAQVVRKRTERAHGLELFGGVAWRRIDAPADEIWSIAVQPQFYRQLLPYAVEARPVQDCVRIRHVVGLSEVSYCVRMRRDDAKHILRFHVRPEPDGSVRRGWAELRVRPLTRSTSLIAWTVMAAPELGLWGGLFRDSVQDAMLQVPSRLQRLVADLGRRNRHKLDS